MFWLVPFSKIQKIVEHTLSFVRAALQLIDAVLEPAIESRGQWRDVLADVDEEAEEHQVAYDDGCSYGDCEDEPENVYVYEAARFAHLLHLTESFFFAG